MTAEVRFYTDRMAS